MSLAHSQPGAPGLAAARKGHKIFGALAPRAYSLLILAALACTLAVKLYIALRSQRLNEYLSWVIADTAALLTLELAGSCGCTVWPHKWVLRTALSVAVIACTWSVMNAGWLVATGTQILPAVLLPLIRDPINALAIVAVNLLYRPIAAAALLTPGLLILAFFFAVLARPVYSKSSPRGLCSRTVICAGLIVAAIVSSSAAKNKSGSITSQELRYNCQLKALETFLSFSSSGAAMPIYRDEPAGASRRIPASSEIRISASPAALGNAYNIIIVVLEGVTNKPGSIRRTMPYLQSIATQGAELTEARCSVSHTTKALFSLLTGRSCSISQDIIEAVPCSKPYASLATILKSALGFRAAFFQSAKGNFECRPGLVHNLGFDKFWARDNLDSEDAYVGYLGSDEFAMLGPLCEWIKSASTPFLLTVLCSVTHDPYRAPDWFGPAPPAQTERYEQALAYTDSFIAALDEQLRQLNLKDTTILCIIGDHGEAFGEHGLYGHARTAFDEVLKIIWIIRAPGLIQPGLKVTCPCSSIDLAPTLLALMQLTVQGPAFDGVNLLEQTPPGRKVFFSCWMQDGPCGFIQDRQKLVYDPLNRLAFAYDLGADPNESDGKELPPPKAAAFTKEILSWRNSTVLPAPSPAISQVTLFENWLCQWNNRKAWAKFTGQRRNQAKIPHTRTAADN
jgi:hypothetical protein